MKMSTYKHQGLKLIIMLCYVMFLYHYVYKTKYNVQDHAPFMNAFYFFINSFLSDISHGDIKCTLEETGNFEFFADFFFPPKDSLFFLNKIENKSLYPLFSFGIFTSMQIYEL